jgi:hypothetical protein
MLGEPSPFVCFWCRVEYTGRPGDHVCADGTTYYERVNKAASTAFKTTVYDDVNVLKLSENDRRMLKGMNIKL